MKPSESQLMQHADTLARLAAADHLENGTDPSDAIAAQKDDMPDSDAFLDLVVSKTNHEINTARFHAADDKREEFPVADSAAVKAAMLRNTKVAHAVSPVWDEDLDAHLLKSHHKISRGTDSRGRALDDYGFPTLEEPKLKVENYYHRKAADTIMQAKLAEELIREDAQESQTALISAIERFKSGIKTAHDFGEDIFQYCQEVVGSVDVEKRAAAAKIADHCVDTLLLEGRIKTAAHQSYVEMTKTASIDMTDDGYQIIRGDDAVVIQLNTALGYDRSTGDHPGKRRRANDSDQQMGIIDYEIPYEVVEIKKPKDASPQIGKIFGDGVID